MTEPSFDPRSPDSRARIDSASTILSTIFASEGMAKVKLSNTKKVTSFEMAARSLAKVDLDPTISL